MSHELQDSLNWTLDALGPEISMLHVLGALDPKTDGWL